MNELDVERIVASVVAAARQEKAPVTDVSLERALVLGEQIKAKARELGVNVVISVCDSHAVPVLTECMDGYLLAAYDIAVNKAYTCAAMKMSTAQLKTLAQPGGSLYGIQHTNNGRIVVFGGGVPLKIGDNVVGGLGVSGGTEEQDSFLAEYGYERFVRKD